MPSARPRSILVLPGLLVLAACASRVTPAPGVGVNAYNQTARLVKANADDQKMSIPRIERFLFERTDRGEIKTPRPGVWHVSIDGVLVLMIAEPARVRILAPIFSLKQLEDRPEIREALLVRLLQANFDRAIDARYAVFDQVVFASITHPRRSLQVEDLDRFLSQVVNLHKNTFRTGERGYSALPPDPDSKEIDPGEDESLEMFRNEPSDEEEERPESPAIFL